jgi:hypothetical protein
MCSVLRLFRILNVYASPVSANQGLVQFAALWSLSLLQLLDSMNSTVCLCVPVD